MDQTIYDVLEGEFDTPFGPDLIAAVEQAPHGRLSDLQERVKAFGPGATVPTKPEGHLRPYVPSERHDLAEMEHGLTLRPGDFRHPERSAGALNALKHHLLYCHSLAVDNPLRWILDTWVMFGPDPYFERTMDEQRPALVNCLRFLHQIEPLVRAGIIVLVETDLEGPPSVPVLGDTRPVAESADFSDLPAEELERLETWGIVAREVFITHASTQITLGLKRAAKHPERLDLYFPYRHYQDVLRSVVERTPQRVPDWPREVELHVLADMLKVSLPGIAELKPTDIVAIRKNEEAFAQWRASLERGLERVRSLDPQTLGHEREQARILQQELLEERRALEDQISKSSFLSQVRLGSKEFVIGGVVALALTPLTGPMGPILAAAGAAGTAGGRVLVDYLGGRRAREEARALHRQYLLFSPGDPAL